MADPKVTTEEIEQELGRVKFNSRYRGLLRSTLYALIITAAVSVLIASLVLPVMQIYGASMAPTLEEGEIVVSVRKRSYARGEVVGLYYANRVLVKRIIAVEFDVVDLAEDGTFTVNGEPLEEPYLEVKSYGYSTDTEFPLQVPEGSYFVAGDNRADSMDSRSTLIGCISDEDIVGRIFFSVWPLGRFGRVK